MTKSRDERFWEKVEPEPMSGCWLWVGARTRSGYGNFWDGERAVPAHRFAVSAPAELNACHKCDNKACVNPDHIFLGTQSDNINDMYAKGRGRSPETYAGRSGESNPMCHLSDEQVASIRALYAAGKSTQKELGQQFGCSQPHISKLVRRSRR